MHIEIQLFQVTRNKGFMGKFYEETAQRIFDYGIKALSTIGVLGDLSGASSDGLAHEHPMN